jgi:hypothetical protein
MGGFLTSMFDEMDARRRRLRAVMGDRGQSLLGFAILAGLALGSLGLFIRTWMAEVAPWGFAAPPVFLLGYVLIDARRQAALKRAADEAKFSTQYDWIALLWSFGCALVGAAAFVIALTSEPPPAPIDYWTPPESSVPVDISP